MLSRDYLGNGAAGLRSVSFKIGCAVQALPVFAGKLCLQHSEDEWDRNGAGNFMIQRDSKRCKR